MKGTHMQEHSYIIPVSFQKDDIEIEAYRTFKRTNDSSLSVMVSLQYFIFKIKNSPKIL